VSLKDFLIKPGFFTLDTDRDSKGRWKNGDHVRFWKGLPQKLGGWQKRATSTFLGICRALTDWETLALVPYIALGTHLKLYVFNSIFYDITPTRTSGTYGNNPLTTTSGSAVVTIHHVAHGELAGDYVTIGGATAVATITVSGQYTVTSVVDADNFTITHSAPANANAVGGGAVVTYVYDIHVGNVDSVPGLGYGAGSYGVGTYGTPRSITDFLTFARIWSLDQWGEDLIGCPRDGGIYLWDASVGTGTRAAAIVGAPTTAKAVFVSAENRQLVVLGASGDPMLIQWSNAEDYSVFTPGETVTAGEKRVDIGNQLYCAVKGKHETLIFSDTYVWSMQFIGPPYNFGFEGLGFTNSIMGPNAAVELNGVAYWMSQNEFYYYDGEIKVLPCDVLNHIVDDINVDQRVKVYAGVNREFGEVWWLYPSSLSTECDRYVAFNPTDGTWVYGTLARTALNGELKTFTDVVATGINGILYDHEAGVDDDGSAMTAYLESADAELQAVNPIQGPATGEGENMMFVRGLIPDFKTLTGSVDITLKAKRYPQSTEQISSTPTTVTASTLTANARIRGRQIDVYIESDEIGDHWRMGRLRLDTRPHGKK